MLTLPGGGGASAASPNQPLVPGDARTRQVGVLNAALVKTPPNMQERAAVTPQTPPSAGQLTEANPAELWENFLILNKRREVYTDGRPKQTRKGQPCLNN